MRISKVVPIERVLNETRRRKDDYEWEGEYEKAKAEMDYIKELKELQEKGEVWYPNFQDTHCHQHLHWHTLLVSFTYGIYMQEETEDGENPNTPFDDVTHWVGNLPRKDTDSTKRVTERSTWRKIKPNILSKKLGVEEKPED